MRVWKFVVFFTLTELLFAQSSDTLKNYNLDEITIKSGIVVTPKTVTKIGLKLIDRSNANSIIGLSKYIPSLKSQTNSRGESLVFLRGSSERQISLFFDGVPLNIPWDNRIDLSLVPANVVGEVNVSKGITSIIYGANNPAGVLSFNTKKIKNKKESKISFSFADDNSHFMDAYYINSFNKLNFLFSASYQKTSNFNLPKNYVPFYIGEETNRNNSASRNINIYSKAEYEIDENNNISFSTSYIDASKNIPPENNSANPRFWQYPDWRKLTLISNSTHYFNKKNRVLSVVLSGSFFHQKIESYKSISFTSLDDVENNYDNYFYGRASLVEFLNKTSLLKFSFSATHLTHKENFQSENFKSNIYTNLIYSSGIEYEYVGKDLSFTLGSSIDGSSTPKTGDKTPKDAIIDYSINSAAVYKITPSFYSQLSFGRKTRFPTLRETFSGALGKFLINPELKAEVSYNTELSLNLRRNNIHGSLVFFFNNLNYGIQRITLPGNRFQRINRDKIRIYGIEFNSNIKFSKNSSANFFITFMNSKSRNASGSFADTLEYKPEIQGGLNVYFPIFKNSEFSIEVNYLSNEFALKEGSPYYQVLPDYILLNSRIDYSINLGSQQLLQFFLRVNNIFDKLYYSQWGLPSPGRELLVGTSLII